MKKMLIVFIVLIIRTNSFSQYLDMSLTISDNAGFSKTLNFGVDPQATDSFDSQFGEEDLPPFPQSGAFEARFILPAGNYNSSESSYKDFRDADLIVTPGDSILFRPKYQANTLTGANRITIKYNLPPDISIRVTNNLNQHLSNWVGNDSLVLTDLSSKNLFLKMWVKFNDPPYPVELSAFYSIICDAGITLIWKTDSEINNYGFFVERYQVDGWQVIGFVQGMGNSNSIKEYSFIDEQVKSGKAYYYRLKQVDTDGKYVYSDSIFVSFTGVSDFKLSNNFPNPFNPVTKFYFNLPYSGNVEINIINSSGQLVKKVVNSFFQDGKHEVVLDCSDLSSGVYFYSVKSAKHHELKKMILIK